MKNIVLLTFLAIHVMDTLDRRSDKRVDNHEQDDLSE